MMEGRENGGMEPKTERLLLLLQAELLQLGASPLSWRPEFSSLQELTGPKKGKKKKKDVQFLAFRQPLNHKDEVPTRSPGEQSEVLHAYAERLPSFLALPS